MLHCIFGAFVILATVALWAHAANEDQLKAPATDPTTAPYSVSSLHQQNFGQLTFLFSTEETTYPKIGLAISRLMPKLTKAMADGKVRPAGPVVFVYRDVQNDTEPFKLDVGVLVAADTAPVDGFTISKLSPCKCATILYTGAVAHVQDGYCKLFGALAPAGLKPTDTFREFYLYWEGPESANNVVQIQIVVE